MSEVNNAQYISIIEGQIIAWNMQLETIRLQHRVHKHLGNTEIVAAQEIEAEKCLKAIDFLESELAAAKAPAPNGKIQETADA